MKTKRYVALRNQYVLDSASQDDQYVVADLRNADVVAWFYKADEKGSTIERACAWAKYMNTLEGV